MTGGIRIFVSGVTGVLGRRVVPAVLADGHGVTVGGDGIGAGPRGAVQPLGLGTDTSPLSPRTTRRGASWRR